MGLTCNRYSAGLQKVERAEQTPQVREALPLKKRMTGTVRNAWKKPSASLRSPLFPGGGNGNEKLSDEYDNTENEPDPGSYNAEDGSERDLIDGMAVISPSFTEADVSKADRAPSEESRQSRQGKKPVEDHFSLCIQIDICQSPTDEN